MKTIAILVPTLKKGGAEKQSIQLLNALGVKYKIDLIIPYPEVGVENELLEGIKAENYEIFKLQGNTLKKLIALYKILRENKPIALFCYLTWPDFYGPIIGKLAGVGKIYQGIRNSQLEKNKLIYEKIGNKFATGVVINNFSGFEWFENKGIKNIVVIPNSYPNIQPPVKRQERKHIKIVTVARFVEQKDYLTAIKAVANVRKEYTDISFEIIGHGVLEQQIREWVSELGLNDIVDIKINPRNIIDLLKDGDIYLSTSLFEGTSNSIMEAMDASLPIVATNVGDNNKLVEDGKNGFLVAAGDVESITEYLLKLTESYELRMQMGLKSNEILQEFYSFEIFKKRYINLLNNGAV